jgi:ribosome-associated toxin RatA of RatAB toxin-antitoxin module
MFTETSVVMNGPRKYIFALAAAIEDWPIILPHYRSVVLTERIKQPDGTIHNVATMKAWRLLPFGKIPVGWRTILDSNAETALLHFVHIGGFTKGMDVHWRLEPEGDATRVTISHDFTLKWPLIGEFVAHRIVGQFFVDAIARRTLARITALVEGGSPNPPAPFPILPGGRPEGGEIDDSVLSSPPPVSGGRVPSGQEGVGMPRD